AAERVERLGRGNAQAAALARREAPKAGVAAELVPVLVHHRPVGRAEPMPLEEIAVVAAGEEACLLTLGAPGNRQAGALCFGPGLGLGLPAEAEPEPVEKARIQAAEHVRLVLTRVCPARQQEPTVATDDARVVAGGQARCSRAGRKVQEL